MLALIGYQMFLSRLFRSITAGENLSVPADSGLSHHVNCDRSESNGDDVSPGACDDFSEDSAAKVSYSRLCLGLLFPIGS